MPKQELIIVKIGGNVIDNDGNLALFLSKFSSIKGPKILVHGGGKLATELSAKLGIETKMVDGKRITDKKTLEIITIVYSGINKKIGAQLNSLHVNALGVCGADMNLFPAKKREHPTIDYGFVGDVTLEEIPLNNWLLLLENNICPVIAPITCDKSGQLLNTNADTIASSIAQALCKNYQVKLIYCFEKDGVLSNPVDENSVIKIITPNSYSHLKQEGVISKGMIPKLDNAWKAIENGVSEVLIGNALHIEELTEPAHTTGTLLYKNEI